MDRNTQEKPQAFISNTKKLLKSKIRFIEKIIHNFLHYALSEEEKQALYNLDEHIPVTLNEKRHKQEVLLQCFATHNTLETK